MMALPLLLGVIGIAAAQETVVVAGGGPLGLAAAINIKKQCPTCAVALLEREFFNQDGSTTGLSRQTRIAYTTELLTTLAINASTMWDELEEEVGMEGQLVDKSGMLWFGNPDTQGSEGQIAAAVTVLESLGLPYQQLNASQLMESFPLQDLPDNYIGLLTAKAGGTIHVPRTMRVFYDLAKKLGVELTSDSELISFTPVEGGVEMVVNQQGTLRHNYADRLILCPGAYVNKLLKPLQIAVNISVWEWSGGYFKTDTAVQQWEKQPVWIRFENSSPSDGGMFFGFPDWHDLGKPGYVRINPGFTKHKFFDPDQRTNQPDVQEMQQTQDFVDKYMTGIDARQMEVANQTCLAVIIGDNGNNMVLSFLPPSVTPHYKNVVLQTGGWGFKLAPLIGKVMAELALTGTTSYNISAFDINQPDVLINL